MIEERFQNTHAQQGVHPTSGTLRVFKPFAWLEVCSVKVALSHPAQPPVTRAVGRFLYRPVDENR